MIERIVGEARGDNILIQLPFSRQGLAAMAGATTETVSRLMSRFAEERLIKSGHKGVAIMTLPMGLKSLANR